MKRVVLLLLALNYLFSSKVNSQENSYSFQNSSLEHSSIQISNELKPLLDLLKKKGFNIKYEIPPKRSVYGLFESRSKIIWISPISFELGIGHQTILHEATHAAQSCPSGLLNPVGWKLPVSKSIRNEIEANLLRNYDINQYIIEKEAFYVQSQKNGAELLIEAIKKRCK